jgi:WD40 repeat protein
MASAWGLQDMVAAACGPVLKVWSALAPGDREAKFNDGTDVSCLEFSHNNKVLAAAGGKGQVAMYSSAQRVGVLPDATLPVGITAMRWTLSSDLVGGCEDGSVHIWGVKGQVSCACKGAGAGGGVGGRGACFALSRGRGVGRWRVWGV